MSTARCSGRALRRPGLAIGAGLLLAALPILKGIAADSMKSPAMAEGWDGIWNNTGGLVYNPKNYVPGKAPDEVRDYPPYNAEWEAKYEQIIAQHKKGIGDDPLGNCLPHGWPRLFGGAPGPIQVIVKPGKTIYMIWEYMNQVRRIYMDGRPVPDDIYPSDFGFSRGHWDGKTLVVDTVALEDVMPFDRTGAPHSGKVHTVERIHMIDNDTLETQITVYDPVAFTKPWVVTRRWKRMPKGTRMQDVYCEVQRNPIVNGQTQVILPGEPGYKESVKAVAGSNQIEGSTDGNDNSN